MALSVDPEFRGRFHLSPPAGWMNDPNGVSWFDGALHVFYQHHPHDSAWGSMHWGHAVTTDLVTWTHLPIALTPDQPYDADGCFSGGAVADGERHVLLYTGHVDPEPSDPARRVESQCLAWGDGKTYTKIANNPVIHEGLLPPGASRGDFRDPKVWKEGDDWYCLVANRAADSNGQILLFTARDPLHWKFVGVVLASGGTLGGMWECPDLAIVEGHEVLLWSFMGQPAEEGRFQNQHATVWAPGALNRRTGAFARGEMREIDHGPDFYAAQTTTLPDGRVILVAWMQMWERSIPTHEAQHGWAGRMTVLREVFRRGDRLVQWPVRELETLRRGGTDHRVAVNGVLSLPGVEGQHLDLQLEFSRWQSQRFGLTFFSGGDEATVLSWEPATGWLVLDRSRGGRPITSQSTTHPQCQVYRVKVSADDRLSLRLILDRSSVEVFAQGGLETLSATVYPRATSRAVQFFSEAGGVELKCQAWSLGSD